MGYVSYQEGTNRKYGYYFICSIDKYCISSIPYITPPFTSRLHHVMEDLDLILYMKGLLWCEMAVTSRWRKIYPSKSKKPPCFFNRLVIGNDLTTMFYYVRMYHHPKRTVTIFVLKNTQKYDDVSNSKNSSRLSTQTPPTSCGHSPKRRPLSCSAAQFPSVTFVYIRPQTFFIWCWWHSWTGFCSKKKTSKDGEISQTHKIPWDDCILKIYLHLGWFWWEM